MRTPLGLALAMLLSSGTAYAQQDPGTEAPPLDMPTQDPQLPEEPSSEEDEEGIGGSGAEDVGPTQRPASPNLEQPPLRDVESLPREVEAATIEGRIVRVDPQQGKITIRDEAARIDVVLEVQDTSRIELEGREVSLQSLQRGADVRASYVVADGALVAQELIAQPPAKQTQEPDSR